MPTYSFEHKQTGDIMTVLCTWDEAQTIINDGDYKMVITAPNIVSSATSTLRQAGSGWKDVLSKVKKGSAKNNTIHD